MDDQELERTFHWMSRLMRRARHHVDPQSPAAKLGIDPGRGQGRILHLLYLRDGISQRDIAFTLDIRPQSIGELIRKLETSGFVERRPDLDDKRVHLVFLTESGKEIAAELDKPRERIDPFAALDEGERAQLAALLDKASEGLAEVIGDDEQDEHCHHHCHRHRPRP